MAAPSFWESGFTASSSDAEENYVPSATGLAGGGFVGVWMHINEAGTLLDARAQAFAADGTKVGDEITIFTGGLQAFYPDVVALSDGGFLLVWTDLIPLEGGSYDIRAQRFDANGNSLGDDFELVDEADGFFPNVVEVSEGRLLVVWGDFAVEPDPNGGVFGQFVNLDGEALSDRFLVNTTKTDVQSAPSVALLPDGDFVVSWSDDSQTGGDTDNTAIRIQKFDADGNKVGGEKLVNTATTGRQDNGEVVVLPSGTIVVVWGDRSGEGGDSDGSAIKLQLFDSDLMPVGGEVLVNTATANDQEFPRIVVLDDGGFLISWDDKSKTEPDTDSGAIRAQRFDANGNPVGDEFVVNTKTEGNQGLSDLAKLADGRVIALWTDVNGDGVQFIAGQILEPREGPVELLGTTLNDDLIGTAFDDTLCGSIGNDKLAGAEGNDEIKGQKGKDTLLGNDGNDILNGGRGKDILNGHDGDDILIGGKKADSLTGELGADIFQFNNLKASKPKTKKQDTIEDFDSAENDQIDVSRIDAKKGGKDNAFEFIGTDKFSGTKGELRINEKANKVVVKADTTGDGKANFAIKVKGESTLTEDDFVL